MSFKTFCLLLLIVLASLLGYLRYEASGSPNSSFNQTRRYSMGKSEFWRWLLSLHKTGDARGQYLNADQQIVIEVLTSKGTEVNEEGLRNFASEVEKITGQKTSLINVDTLDKTVVNDRDLSDIVKDFRRHKTFGQPNIFVVYTGDFEGSDNGPSKPFNEYGILVSERKLKELTYDNNYLMREYLPAVMLHSFGLQLGLEDKKNTDCIMQETVLKPSPSAIFLGHNLTFTYCDAELNQAKQIGESLK